MSVLLIEKGPEGLQAAVMNRGRLYAFQAEDGGMESCVFLGVVDRAIKGVSAVFVRLPDHETGFLQLSPNEKKPASGERVIVQVKRPPNQNKKALLTRDIALAGSYIVYLPLGKGVHVSSRIETAEEKSALREKGQCVKPGTGGVILRSAAASASAEQLSSELSVLSDCWRRIREKAASVSAPALLRGGEDLIGRMLAEETGRLEYILTNEPSALPKGCEIPVRSCEHPFLLHNIRDRLEKSLRRTVRMKSGATLVIDPCEAMTVIDVNSAMASGGKSIGETAERVNAEAAWEIARLLRLRGIGGMIVVDFIDMASAEAKERLIRTMREALAEDPVKTTVHGITTLGLMEITRRRTQTPLGTLPDTPCPHCGGTGVYLSDTEEDAQNA